MFNGSTFNATTFNGRRRPRPAGVRLPPGAFLLMVAAGGDEDRIRVVSADEPGGPLDGPLGLRTLED